MELPGAAQRVHERSQRIEWHIKMCYGYDMHALLLAAGILAAPVQYASLDYDLPIPAMLYEPAVTPAPAVVVLHTCAGVDQDVTDWAKWLAANGYIALVPDSFTPRHVSNVCGTHDVPPATRALDAYGALSYLRTRPDVDAAHVGEIGFSHGGGTILYTEARLAAHPPFEAAVALYPSACADRPASTLAFPLMLLIGGADDWTDAKTCTDYIASIDPSGALSTVHVYPGAYHKFDDPQANRTVHIRSHAYTLLYDAQAAEDAHARVLAFFKKYL